jgi:quercetin 2,3-dioxygenase
MEKRETLYKYIKSDSRGGANHGWLKAKHSFSFANYYDPERVHFGALRVLNDDIVAPSEGFGKHPHDNMEIITIPIKGELRHEDSIGNSSVITAGEIQVMSAGSGVFHSEMNNSTQSDVELLQIWVFPNEKGVTPRYDQKRLSTEAVKNQLLNIIQPKGENNPGAIWIYQNAWFYLGEFDSDREEIYRTKSIDNGIYVFVIEGEVKVQNYLLSKRDALAVINADELRIEITKGTNILIMEVPLKW